MRRAKVYLLQRLGGRPTRRQLNNIVREVRRKGDELRKAESKKSDEPTGEKK